MIALGAIAAVTVLALGVDSYRAYALDALPRVQWYRGLLDNVSLPGFWSRLFEAIPPVAWRLPHARPIVESPALFLVATATSSLALAGALTRSMIGRGHSGSDDLGYGAAVVAMLLISPVTWSHSLLMLILPGAILWRDLRSPASRACLVAIVAVLAVHPGFFVSRLALPTDGSGVATAAQSLGVVSLQFYSLLGFFAMIAVAVRRARLP